MVGVLIIWVVRVFYTLSPLIVPHVHVCSSVRVWKEGGKCEMWEAHKPAVWALAGLHTFDGSRRILSGTYQHIAMQ